MTVPDTSSAGWGENWGANYWGDNTDALLELLSADAGRENVVRLVFNRAPSFTGLLDLFDASRRQRYAVVTIGGTFGIDDQPARPVQVLTAAPNYDADALGRIVDITVDRHLSSYPARYQVIVNNLVTADDGSPLNPVNNTATFYGTQLYELPPNPETANESRDIANPQTLESLLEATGGSDPTGLGTYPIDGTGDYATDSGIHNLKKRVFRRIMTLKGAFLHAPEYGLGIAAYSKRLNVPANRALFEKEAESQISQEPDVKKVKVQVLADVNTPGLIRIFIFVRTVSGSDFKFETPTIQVQ